MTNQYRYTLSMRYRSFKYLVSLKVEPYFGSALVLGISIYLVLAKVSIGLSMGGMIGQQLGARYPERVYSLSLCDTASEMPPRSLWEERFEIARKEGIAGLVDGTIKRWFTAPFIARAPQDIAKVREMILGTGVEGYLGCASAVRDMAQTTMLLKIKAPTLILTGRQDPACTVDQAIVLNRMIDGSKFVILEDAAHLSNIEQPEAFNRTVRDFIDSVDNTL